MSLGETLGTICNYFGNHYSSLMNSEVCNIEICDNEITVCFADGNTSDLVITKEVVN